MISLAWTTYLPSHWITALITKLIFAQKNKASHDIQQPTTELDLIQSCYNWQQMNRYWCTCWSDEISGLKPTNKFCNQLYLVVLPGGRILYSIQFQPWEFTKSYDDVRKQNDVGCQSTKPKNLLGKNKTKISLGLGPAQKRLSLALHDQLQRIHVPWHNLT